jgi:hypothetical protein
MIADSSHTFRMAATYSLDFSLFGNLQRVIDFDVKVTCWTTHGSTSAFAVVAPLINCGQQSFKYLSFSSPMH